jgi:hypothetical protein
MVVSGGYDGRLQNVSKTADDCGGCLSTREYDEENRKSRETKPLDQKSRAITSLEERVTLGSNPAPATKPR